MCGRSQCGSCNRNNVNRSFDHEDDDLAMVMVMMMVTTAIVTTQMTTTAVTMIALIRMTNTEILKPDNNHEYRQFG